MSKDFNSMLQGNTGEAVALLFFIKHGYEVYLPFNTGSTCDLIVTKYNKTYRVSVKSTSFKHRGGKRYMLNLSQRTSVNKKFDAQTSDLVFGYVVPEDRFKILPSKKIKAKYSISI